MRNKIVICLIAFGLLIAFVGCNSPATAPLVTTPTSSPTASSTPELGTELVLRANLSQIGAESAIDAINADINIIESRLNAYDAKGYSVTRQGNDTIVIRLSKTENADAVIRLLTATGILDFREQVYDSYGNPLLDENGNPQWIPAKAIDTSGNEVQLTGRYLTSNATVILDPNTNEYSVTFEFDDQGAILFSEITGRLIGKPLGIFFDNALISSPTVQAVISAKGVIANLGQDEATRLAIILNSGALVVPVESVQSTP
jgi:preprotein translocase subunit SecD